LTLQAGDITHRSSSLVRLFLPLPIVQRRSRCCQKTTFQNGIDVFDIDFSAGRQTREVEFVGTPMPPKSAGGSTTPLDGEK
jgi:hypothetical protein